MDLKPELMALGFYALPVQVLNSLTLQSTIHQVFAKSSKLFTLELNYLPPFTTTSRLRKAIQVLCRGHLVTSVDLKQSSALVSFANLEDPLSEILRTWPKRLPDWPEQTPEDVAASFAPAKAEEPTSKRAKRKVQQASYDAKKAIKQARLADKVAGRPALPKSEEGEWTAVTRGGKKSRSETLIDTQVRDPLDLVEFGRGKPSVGIISREKLAALQAASAADANAMEVDGQPAVTTANRRKKKNKATGLTDFYATREDKRKAAAAVSLQARFKEDQDVVMEMKQAKREARKYKPY